MLGCAMGALSLQAVISIRALSGDADKDRELEDGVAAVAASVWLVALLPPRLPDVDFPYGYFPVSMATVMVMRSWSALRKVSQPRLTVVRHFAALAALVPAVGLLV